MGHMFIAFGYGEKVRPHQGRMDLSQNLSYKYVIPSGLLWNYTFNKILQCNDEFNQCQVFLK